jgi:hypothetical protein
MRISGSTAFRPLEEEGCASLRDGLEAKREPFGARRGDNLHGYRRSEDRPQRVTRHSLQQACSFPVERPAREGRVSIEDLAEAIARRTLLQSLSVHRKIIIARRGGR